MWWRIRDLESWEGKPCALTHMVCANDLQSRKLEKYVLYEFKTMYKGLKQGIWQKWG